MTKFEEELSDKGVEIFTHMDGCTISKKVCINYADVVNLSEGWVSPEEHQARVNELIEAKEKKIKQLRKINHLYKKSKENAERLAVDRGERLNQAQDELASLESQLQQQALPVVPELTQKQSDILNDYKNGSGSLASYLSTEIKKGDYDYFARAWLDGYTVEKPQLFYLKNTITKAFLYDNGLEFGECDENCKDWEIFKTKFTKQEIDSMETGSYELVPVEDGE
ncbi:DUF1642 domain-containing protein [Lactococcus lactis]|uniref:DUF1642 domain-containing protein n=1 Tax=Lactococcus lactis TaxID=1358 RepID=UPI003F27845D